jgi:hypothetical protein
MKAIYSFLDRHPWASWAGLGLCVLAVGAVEATAFPF